MSPDNASGSPQSLRLELQQRRDEIERLNYEQKVWVVPRKENPVKPSNEYEVDKSRFGDGPWQHELDRAEWRHLGLPCLIVRNWTGAMCGYVGLPPGHPWRSGSAIDAVSVHGGITYTGKCNGHICHTPWHGESDDVVWVGFDCAHAGDFIPSIGRNAVTGDQVYRDVDYVRREVELLARQAKDAA